MLSTILPGVLTGIGAFITIYIINNTKLREGLTDWFLSYFKRGHIDFESHNIKETIIQQKFNAKHTEFNNDLKTELFHYYVDVTLTTMEQLVDEVLEQEKKLNIKQLKLFIKQKMYNRLSVISSDIDKKISMPEPLQDKFDRFKNHLAKQHTHAIDNALTTPDKKTMVIKVLDAIENNSMWFTFYSIEMFETFNGHFDKLDRTDIFKY